MPTITVQIGNYANFVSSHIWNLQYDALLNDTTGDEVYNAVEHFRCIETSDRQVRRSQRAVVCDLRENFVFTDPYEHSSRDTHRGAATSIWSGITTKIERAESELRPTFIAESRASFWSDYIQQPYHAKSVCEMPLWTTSQQFDTYFAGLSPEILPTSVKDDIIDRVRYFAEECDNIGCLRVFADLYDGFGGLSCSVVEELRDDFPSTAMPVWGFTEASGQQVGRETVTIRSNLHSLGVPLCYTRLRDAASIIIPIGNPRAIAEQLSPSLHVDGREAYQSSAVVAMAIEAAIGYQSFQSRPNKGSRNNNADEDEDEDNDDGDEAEQVPLGPKEWCNMATRGSAFPFCSLEACVPFPTSALHVVPTLDHLWQTFDAPDPELSQAKDQVGSSGSASLSKDLARTTLNPFMRSLSAAAVGQWAAPLANRIRDGRAYTNLVSIRCPNCPELTTKLFEKCFMSPYMLSVCHQRQSPLRIQSHRRFPSIFDADDCQWVAAAAAVGCDASMGAHLEVINDQFARRANTSGCKAQLEKAGLGPDEVLEIKESMLDTRKRYDPAYEL